MGWTFIIFLVAVFSLFVVTTVICLTWSQCCMYCKILQQKPPGSSAPVVGQEPYPQHPRTIQPHGSAIPWQDPPLYSGAEPSGEPPPYHEIVAGEGNYTIPASMTADDCSFSIPSVSLQIPEQLGEDDAGKLPFPPARMLEEREDTEAHLYFKDASYKKD